MAEKASTRITNVEGDQGVTIGGDVSAGRDVHITNKVQSGRVQMIQRRTESRIQEWTPGMVTTAALTEVLEKLERGTNWVTIKGQSGEGKSTVAYMALKELKTKREVFQVLSPEELSEITETCSHPVIMIDDVFGQLEFNEAEWSKWSPVLNQVLGGDEHRSHEQGTEKSKAREVSIILVGREYVLNSASSDMGRMSDYFTHDKHVVNMSNTERDIQEKQAIWKVISRASGIELDEETIDRICKIRVAHGFPHVCRLFVTMSQKDPNIDAESFFQAPLEFLNQTVQKFMKDEIKLSLFKEIIKRNGSVSKRDLESVDNSSDIIDVANSLVGSYLSQEDGNFKFNHPSIYDSVAFNICKTSTLFVIENCHLSFLHERVRLEPSRDTRLVVTIPRCYITDLAKRFAAEIKNRNLRLVLSHTALTDQLFIEELMHCITLSPTKLSQRIAATLLMLIRCKTYHALTLTKLLTLTDKQTYRDLEFKERHHTFLSLVASNKSPQLLKYIDKQTDIQLTEGDINTVLYGVCKYAASDVLTYLVQSRDTLDIHVRYEYGLTPLMIAAETRDSQFVQQLISLGPNLTATDTSGYRRPVLHYLCRSGLKAAVEEVIDRGEDINVEDGWGESPLYWACLYNQVEVARLLLNRGARLDARTVVGACRGGSLDLVELMFELGATVNMTSYNTPLTAASEGGHVKVMRFLIGTGASVNIADERGQSPLHSGCGGNNPQAVQWLLDQGAEINSEDRRKGNTSLHIAAGRGHKDVVNVLVNGGAIIDSTNIHGQTPLHTAVYYKPYRLYLPDISVCQTLIRHGALINKQDSKGNTPLHLLCQVDSHTEIHKDYSCKPASVYKDLYRSLVRLFVDHGADREIQNNIGTLALHGWCKTLTD